jgi:hypothetical protein
MRPLLIVLAALPTVSGCSTFETRDVYRTSDAARYEASGVLLAVGFEPDTRFYSVGLLGLPLVPTVMSASPRTDLALAVQLRLERNLDFSFSSSPCLNVSGKPLCPSQIELRAVAMAQDDGSAYADRLPRWDWLSEFKNARHMIVEPAPSTRIEKEHILAHYNYSGSRWGYLLVEATYKYECGAALRPLT